MNKKLMSFVLAAALLLAVAMPALADGLIQWTGHGSENLPCAAGAHWILAPAFGIDAATLTVNGVSYTMVQSGQGSWAADSVGTLDENLTATVTYTGAGDQRNQLQLSHCVGTPQPTPTYTATPTPTGEITLTPSPTGEYTVTPTPEDTPEGTPTYTITPSPTGEITLTPTDPATPTDTPTYVVTPVRPTNTPTTPPGDTPTPQLPNCENDNLYRLVVEGNGNIGVVRLELSEGGPYADDVNGEKPRFELGLPDTVKVMRVYLNDVDVSANVTTDDGLGLPTSASRCTQRVIYLPDPSGQPTPTDQPGLPTGEGGGSYGDAGNLAVMALVVLVGLGALFSRKPKAS